ncbi:MAG: ethanolamine utilization protein EutJ [Acidobacteriota bacterium]
MDGRLPSGRGIVEYLNRAGSVILASHLSAIAPPAPVDSTRKLRVGVDLGTAYLVLVVLDEDGAPVAGEWQFAQVVRDGLVVDFIGAARLLREMRRRVERRVGSPLTRATTGYPPGVPPPEARAKAHVVEAAGMNCNLSIDEPTAANNVLLIREGAIVDVGGGTTGIAVIRDGQVVYTADEATGGTHFSLVLAGALRISFEEAEALKITRQDQPRLLPMVRPVMEKVAAIILRHTRNWRIGSIALVGGASAFLGMADVIQRCTGIPTFVPENPLFVTPLGIALHGQPHHQGSETIP